MHNNKTIIISSTLGALFIIFIVFAVMYGNTVIMKVTALHYTRSIDVEHYITVTESGWSLPENAEKIRQYSAYHHTDRYLRYYNTTCTGSGKSQVCSSEPVYGYDDVYMTKYDYYIDRWVAYKTLTKIGIGEAAWPNTDDLRYSNNLPRINDERLGTKHEQYVVEFLYNNTTYSKDVTFDQYRTFKIGSDRSVILNLFGGIKGFAD